MFKILPLVVTLVGCATSSKSVDSLAREGDYIAAEKKAAELIGDAPGDHKNKKLWRAKAKAIMHQGEHKRAVSQWPYKHADKSLTEDLALIILWQELQSGNPESVLAAIEVVERHDLTVFVDNLGKLLQHDDERIVARSGVAMFRFGDMKKHLRRLLRSSNDEVRIIVGRGILRKGDAELKAELAARIGDSNETVRKLAIQAIRNNAVLKKVLSDEDSGVRAAAIRRLGTIGDSQPLYEKLLQESQAMPVGLALADVVKGLSADFSKQHKVVQIAWAGKRGKQELIRTALMSSETSHVFSALVYISVLPQLERWQRLGALLASRSVSIQLQAASKLRELGQTERANAKLEEIVELDSSESIAAAELLLRQTDDRDLWRLANGYVAEKLDKLEDPLTRNSFIRILRGQGLVSTLVMALGDSDSTNRVLAADLVFEAL